MLLELYKIDPNAMYEGGLYVGKEKYLEHAKEGAGEIHWILPILKRECRFSTPILLLYVSSVM